MFLILIILDFRRLRTHCAQKPFDGYMISIQKVVPPLAIQVCYTNGTVTDNYTLELFMKSCTSPDSVISVEDTGYVSCKLVHFSNNAGTCS